MSEETPRQRNSLLKFFKCDHLPEKLKSVSEPFCKLAFEIENLLPPGAEATTALRKLLESKDCAVRAAL